MIDVMRHTNKISPTKNSTSKSLRLKTLKTSKNGKVQKNVKTSKHEDSVTSSDGLVDEEWVSYTFFLNAYENIESDLPSFDIFSFSIPYNKRNIFPDKDDSVVYNVEDRFYRYSKRFVWNLTTVIHYIKEETIYVQFKIRKKSNPKEGHGFIDYTWKLKPNYSQMIYQIYNLRDCTIDYLVNLFKFDRKRVHQFFEGWVVTAYYLDGKVPKNTPIDKYYMNLVRQSKDSIDELWNISKKFGELFPKPKNGHFQCILDQPLIHWKDKRVGEIIVVLPFSKYKNNLLVPLSRGEYDENYSKCDFAEQFDKLVIECAVRNQVSVFTIKRDIKTSEKIKHTERKSTIQLIRELTDKGIDMDPLDKMELVDLLDIAERWGLIDHVKVDDKGIVVGDYDSILERQSISITEEFGTLKFFRDCIKNKRDYKFPAEVYLKW